MKYGSADAEVGERREADERLGQIERKQAAVNREADREHQRQRDEKDQALRPAAEPQVAGAGMAQDARHSSTSVPDCVSSAAVARTVVSLPDYLRRPAGHRRQPMPRDGGAERRAGGGADRIRRACCAGRPFVERASPASGRAASRAIVADCAAHRSQRSGATLQRWRGRRRSPRIAAPA